ncbi:MAG: hypothetical protein JWR02_3 [Mucilaginibacter sp.]|nr:hypothetical protein [Mucilaginibacter sp.]
MVELLTDLPPHVAAYKAVGAVSKEEYEEVVMRRVDQVAAEYGTINFLVLLETGFENYSIGAFIDYIKVSFEHFSKWNRMAIVTDQEWVAKAYNALSYLVHGEIRSYPVKSLETAKAWVSAPPGER